MRSLLVLVLAMPVLVAAGCGGGSDDKTTPAATPNSRPMQLDPRPPSELIGTYVTTLRRADLPADPPPELDGRDWRMRFNRRGGAGDAPSLVLTRPPDEPLEVASFSASGSTLTVRNLACAPSKLGGRYTYVTSTYRWKLDGDTLRLSSLKNGCSDQVAETILTSRPWKKQS